MEDRATALLDVFRQGLQLSGEQQTKAMLGDRSSYIGMSDIGRYSECPRAAVANKLHPQPTELGRLLALQRGHWFEYGAGQCLKALNLHMLPQLEVSFTWQETPIRAHLDFTLVWDAPVSAVRILEVKSRETIPSQPNTAHGVQIQGQVSILRWLWGQPVFNLRSPDDAFLHENMTFPQLCKAHFGLTIPKTPEGVSLEGWLLCLSMQEARAFGPYVHDADMLERALRAARDLWTDMRAVREGSMPLNDVSCVKGFHPLCGVCCHNADCPKFPQGDYQPQWEGALARLEEVKASRTVLDAEIREMETALKQAHMLSGTKDWITTGRHRFRATTVAGRRTLDRESMREELEAICAVENITPIDVPAMFARHEREGAPSTRLSITTIN